MNVNTEAADAMGQIVLSGHQQSSAVLCWPHREPNTIALGYRRDRPPLMFLFLPAFPSPNCSRGHPFLVKCKVNPLQEALLLVASGREERR